MNLNMRCRGSWHDSYDYFKMGVSVMRMKRLKYVMAATVILVLAGAVFTSLLADKDEIYRRIRKNFVLFNQIYEAVNAKYVDEVDVDELMQASIRGMLDTLDPYTQYLEKDSYDELRIGTKGKFEGLGINIGIRDGVLTVISPIEGTPAHRVGIQSGDRVIEIEGQSTKGYSTDKAASLLRGPKGTQVNITIEREGVPEPIDYTVTRDVIEVKSVSYAGVVSDSIGYVRLRRFSQESGQEVKEAVQKVQSQGIKGLIFDIRMNSGGLLSEAVDVTDTFLPNGALIVSTKGRNGEAGVEFRGQEPPVFGEKPLVVLVDQGSASASEIFAGAIQDWDRGLIVGTTTFGKGLVQSILPLGADEALKITTAKYYTPSGRCIQKDEQTGDEDEQKKPEGETPGKEPYHTQGGRLVYGGGGVTPDAVVEASTLTRFESELMRRGLFMGFAATYASNHPDMPEHFEVTPTMLAQFQKYVEGKDLKYDAAGASEITKLREIFRKEGYSPAAADLLADLGEQIEIEKKGDFERSRTFIEDQLKAQIALDLWGSEKETEIRLQNDPQVAYALDLLRNPDQYYSNLAVAPTGE